MKRELKKVIFVYVLLIAAFATLLSGAAAIPGSKATVETIVISEGNTAPIAENVQLRTFRGIKVSGEMKALDPESEEVIFEVTSQPKRGKLNLGEKGEFVYDPTDTKKSSDSFTYTAIDKSGNRSNTATVTIEILKQKEAIVYEDMADSDAHYAALALNEAGIMTGECIAGTHFFRPSETVTQGEFLAMCLKASGTDVLDDVVRTGLVNDEQIPVWAKQYVSTAVLNGCYTGSEAFEYDKDITYEEAAVTMDSAFRLTDVTSVMSISPYLRESSYQSVMNIYACGVADETLISNYDLPLTREDTAKMICKAMEIIGNR